MQRRPLLELLDRYAALHADEHTTVTRIRELVEEHDECFARSCLPGHVTASAWVLSPDGRHCLLTHHRKLGRWLQLGGHADGDGDVRRVALREVREESGMTDFEWVPAPHAPGVVPLDVDVHVIPARGGEPVHEHHDIRFLLRARSGQALRISAESNDLRWIEVERLRQYTTEESVLRLARKARDWFAAAG